MQIFKNALFVFRQDLRIHDNTGLIKACKQSAEVTPLFIIDPTILNNFPDNDKRLEFLHNALTTLDYALHEKGSKLQVIYGDPQKLITQLVKKHGFDAVFMNESYGYNAVGRDAFLQSRGREHGVHIDLSHDFLLVPINAIPARKVFTPFFKLRSKYLEANQPVVHRFLKELSKHHTITGALTKNEIKKLLVKNHDKKFEDIRPVDHKKRLHTFSFYSYAETRNSLSVNGVSKMSPYIRFGLLSIRELYCAAAKQKAQVYISELAWREFRNHIFYNFPQSRELEFQEKKRGISWDNNLSYFEARKNGMTGYPIVDAGMRQLRAEGRMHNRTRMIVASFLTKDLLIDWRRGEKHFAKYLLDYDTNVNIGNWQRSASVGADPKPLRIFSPMLQSEKFDPECIYIKKWIPELAQYSPEEIHHPLEYDLGYAKPIVDHKEQIKKIKEVYYAPLK